MSQHLQINYERLNFLLNLYSLTKNDLVNELNSREPKTRVTSIKEEDIFTEDKKNSSENFLSHSKFDNFEDKQIELTLLKKIDRVFEKGLPFYLDKAPPVKNNETSIFFRKNTFNAELNFESRKVVNFFEEKKI